MVAIRKMVEVEGVELALVEPWKCVLMFVLHFLLVYSEPVWPDVLSVVPQRNKKFGLKLALSFFASFNCEFLYFYDNFCHFQGYKLDNLEAEW